MEEVDKEISNKTENQVQKDGRALGQIDRRRRTAGKKTEEAQYSKTERQKNKGRREG